MDQKEKLFSSCQASFACNREDKTRHLKRPGKVPQCSITDGDKGTVLTFIRITSRCCSGPGPNRRFFTRADRVEATPSQAKCVKVAESLPKCVKVCKSTCSETHVARLAESGTSLGESPGRHTSVSPGAGQSARRCAPVSPDAGQSACGCASALPGRRPIGVRVASPVAVVGEVLLSLPPRRSTQYVTKDAPPRYLKLGGFFFDVAIML